MSLWGTVAENIAARKNFGVRVGGEGRHCPLQFISRLSLLLAIFVSSSLDPFHASNIPIELIPQTSHILAQSFHQNPVLTYILSPKFPSLDARNAFLPCYFRVLCRAASLNSGIFLIAGEEERSRGTNDEREIKPEAAALLLLPGSHIDSTPTLWKSGFIGLMWDIGLQGLWRMNSVQGSVGGMVGGAVENDPYASDSDTAPGNPFLAKPKSGFVLPYSNSKKKEMKGYYHLYQLGTLPASRSKGLGRRILESIKEVVEREGRREPVWLEATSEEGRRAYEKAGWRVVGIGRVGEGTVNAEGLPEKGGEGVRIWGMVWWPEERVELG